MQQSHALSRVPLYRTIDRLPVRVMHWLLLLPVVIAGVGGLYWQFIAAEMRAYNLDLEFEALFILSTTPAMALVFNLLGTVLIFRLCEEPILKLMGFTKNYNEADLVTPLREVLLYSLPFYPLAVFFSVSTSAGLADGNITVALLVPNSISNLVRNYIVTPAWVMTIGVFVACFLRQYKMLLRLARELPIRILPMPDYSPISEPFMRLLLLSLVVVSVFPLIGIMLGGSEAEFVVDLVAISAFVLAVPLLIAFLRPIWILQGRFLAEKLSQQEGLQAKLIDAVESKADNLQALLSRQLYIESRTTWPISERVQRLFLIGLLPPLTWILAAVVENFIY